MRRAMEFHGDPKKAAQAMIDISKVPDPPLRLVLGSDALMVVRTKLGDVEKEVDKWEKVSLSTAMDDDGEAERSNLETLRAHGYGKKE